MDIVLCNCNALLILIHLGFRKRGLANGVSRSRERCLPFFPDENETEREGREQKKTEEDGKNGSDTLLRNSK